MTVHDITQPLVDSAVLFAMAERAGITPAQVKAVCGMLADMKIRDAIRICVMCQRERFRQSQRDARMKR